jgi:hypothetical protein
MGDNNTPPLATKPAVPAQRPLDGEVIPPPDLVALAKIINTAYTTAVDCIRSSVKAAMTAGDALIKVKDALSHGEFTPWVSGNTDMMPRTVQEWMFLARHRRQIEAWLRDSPGGTITGALRMLRQSPDPKPEATISEDAIVLEITKKVQTVLGKDHQRGLAVAARMRWLCF